MMVIELIYIQKRFINDRDLETFCEMCNISLLNFGKKTEIQLVACLYLINCVLGT